MVIVLNCVFLIVETSEENQNSDFFAQVDIIFLWLYFTEMMIKIIGLGFILNKGSYLRDSWNILDFVIVVSAFMTKYLTVIF